MPTLDEQRDGNSMLLNNANRKQAKRQPFNLYLAVLEISAALLSLWLFDELSPAHYSGVLHIAVFVVCAILTGAWAGQVFRDPTQGFVSSTRAVLLTVPGYVLFDSGQEDPLSLQTLFAATAGLLPLLLAARWFFRRVVITQRAKGHFLEGAVLVGTAEEVRQLSESISSNRSFGYKVVAVATLPGLPEVKIDADSLRNYLQSRTIIDLAGTSGAGCVFLGLEATRNSEFIEELTWEAKAANVELYFSRPLGSIPHSSFQIVSSLGKLMLRLDDPTNKRLSKISKRVFDIVFGLVFLVISLPIQLTVATTILLVDRQFPLFAQKRVGLGGKLFWIYKFRTMNGSDSSHSREHLNSDNRAGNEIQFKLKTDPRVTTLGKVLRRFSLDELPQLFNVLSGSMSLVGPRPHVLDEVEEYDKRAANRLLIKPGITGAWQISGRSDLSWEESVQLDLNYVQNWSLVLDFVILLKTVWAVLRGQGAY